MKCTKSKTKYWVYGVNSMTLEDLIKQFEAIEELTKHIKILVKYYETLAMAKDTTQANRWNALGQKEALEYVLFWLTERLTMR